MREMTVRLRIRAMTKFWDPKLFLHGPSLGRFSIKKPAPDYSSVAIKHDLDRLKQAWQRFQSTRNRDAVYPYLREVYDLVSLWKSGSKGLSRATRILRRRNVIVRSDKLEVYAAALRAGAEAG